MKRVLLFVALLAVAGCASSPKSSKDPLATRADAADRGDLLSVLLAPAGAASERALVPVAWMGGLLLLAGAAWSVMAVFTGKGLVGGAVLFATGAAVVGCAVLYLEYPWVCLVAATLGVVCFVALWSSTRTKCEKQERALEIIVPSVDESGDAAKARIRARGPDAEEAVREVVGPIKKHFRVEPKTGRR